jgi:DNA polymerase-1
VNAPPTDRPTLFLLDGYALMYRAFFAMISRPLTTSSGENTSAPYGIARFLLRLVSDYEPDYLGVVFDAGDSQRGEIFPDYKATREKMPDELRASLVRCREIFEAFRVPVLEAPGWEADDVIGTLARQAAAQGLRTVTFTSWSTRTPCSSTPAAAARRASSSCGSLRRTRRSGWGSRPPG